MSSHLQSETRGWCVGSRTVLGRKDRLHVSLPGGVRVHRMLITSNKHHVDETQDGVQGGSRG